MVTDEQVQQALDYLRDSAPLAAGARADRIYAEEYRKSLKALLMKEHIGDPVSAQEREAYADERYQRHLKDLRTAVFEDEKQRAMRVAAEMKIEAWRTQQANYRAMKL